MSAARKNLTEQSELFFATPFSGSIEVGPRGVAQDWLAQQLRLTVDQLLTWQQRGQLATPRDYYYRRGCFYTAAGVRRIFELAGIKNAQAIERP